MTPWATAEGLPYPLGVSWCAADRAYNFALYSKHATSVRLLLFGDDVERPRAEIVLDPLAHKSGRVWHCRAAAAAADGCRYYAYLVDGPGRGARSRSTRSIPRSCCSIHMPAASCSRPASTAARR